jgi:hypothetical protein
VVCADIEDVADMERNAIITPSQQTPEHSQVLAPNSFQSIWLIPWKFLTKARKMSLCCILRGPGGERIVDIVPGGTDLELQLIRGVGQAAHTRNNPHVNFTGVY